MINCEDFELFDKCVKRWGTVSQILMTLEEMNELSVELLHSIRSLKSWDIVRIIEEITDVKLMLDQIQFIFKISDAKLSTMRHKKIKRLKTLLNIETQTQKHGLFER